MQAKLSEQQTRTQEAEETIELLKKENGVMKGHGVKLKNAQKEIERLREAWTDKDVQLAEANSSASQQRHVGLLPQPAPAPPPFPTPALPLASPRDACGHRQNLFNGALQASCSLVTCMAITRTMTLKTISDPTLTN